MKHSEASLTALLRSMYAPPHYAFFAGVRNSTGYRSTVRTADGLAMGLWPSRGLNLIGFEIKTARNDWLRELKDPSKAEEIASRCDLWFVVAPEDVVTQSEVPATWGWLAPVAKKGKQVLVEIKAPVLLKAAPMDRVFLASILRRAMEDSPGERALAQIREETAQAEHAKYARILEEHDERTQKLANRERDELRQRIQRFEAISGVSLAEWNLGNVAEAVKVIQSKGKAHLANRLKQEALEMRNAASMMDEAVKALET